MSIVLVILYVMIFLSMTLSLKICSENERLYVLRLGRELSPRGPGLVIQIPFVEKMARIKVDSRGEVVSDADIKLGEINFPYQSEKHLSVGTIVRIIGFEGNGEESTARVIVEDDQRRAYRCEKCGHLNESC